MLAIFNSDSELDFGLNLESNIEFNNKDYN